MANSTVDDLSDKILDFIKDPHVVSSSPRHLDLAIAIIVLEYRMRGYARKYLEVEKEDANLSDYNSWYNNKERMQNPCIVEKYRKGGFYNRIKPIANIRNDVIHANSVQISTENKKEYINTIKDFCNTFPQIDLTATFTSGVPTMTADLRVDRS